MSDMVPVFRTAGFDLEKEDASGGSSRPAPRAAAYQLGMRFESEEVPVLHEFLEVDHAPARREEERKAERQREARRLAVAREKEERRRLAERQERLAAEKAAEVERLKEEKRRQEVLKAEEARREAERLRLAKQREEEELARIAAEKVAEEKKLRVAAEKAAEAERSRIEQRKAAKERAERFLEEERIRQEQEEIRLARLRAEEQLRLESELREKAFKAKKEKKPRSQGNISNFHLSDFWSVPKYAFGFNLRKAGFSFAAVSLAVALGIGSVSFAQRGLALKGRVLGVSQDGYQNLSSAASNLAGQNFANSAKEFAAAEKNFSQAADDLDSLGGILVEASRYLPYVSKLSSGKNVAEAGKHISAAGQALNEVAASLASLKNSENQEERSGLSLLDAFNSAEKNVRVAKEELALAKESVDKVNIDDLPQEKREKFLLLKERLPVILGTFDEFLNNAHIMADLLGGNGPRKYLFLFQNNTEMRATGGFIGSYGLLDISQGHVRSFFVDGIFNPDGQLKAKIIPPGPIQKISAAWSLHDSNWFPDFPTSARKAIDFYEKTGGPTVDGVITLTPTVMEKLLALIGPVEMPDYGVTLTAENFVEKTQHEVEADYDKEENKPKKILSDLAPIVLERVANAKDTGTLIGAAKVLSGGLKEKHILLYSENKDLQKIIAAQGWSGEILPAEKDYLSVINTNINGFKTDAVVEEDIDHHSEIREDGTIVDTVAITRRHKGGGTPYEWWNKVNADYMRVYVPLGSELIEASGQTRELDKAPLDYGALGFKKDEAVAKEEKSMRFDEKSGTRIYEDAGKTVFADWTYVSPGETVTVTYRYLLPFKLFQVSFGEGEQADSYSLVAQKQSGSRGSAFSSTVEFPKAYAPEWTYPANAKVAPGAIKTEAELSSDQFVGIAFKKKD